MSRLVAVTPGDPAGIGPEVLAKALRARPRLAARCLLVGAPWQVRVPRGRVSRAAGAAALDWLREGVRAVLTGRAAALVTGPVSKEAIARILPGFTGQTEFVAAAAGVREPVMLLGGPELKVVIVTRHMALARVPRALSAGLVARAIRITAGGLTRWFGIARPRLAICGLNPHAGEGGLLGREDSRIVAPAVRAVRRSGIRAVGPLPGDAVFAPANRRRYDAVVAMYHDQGLAPLKAVEGGRAVNATLGLPFLRVSPAHGTAFDIAGRGRADPTSMIAALETAVRAAS